MTMTLVELWLVNYEIKVFLLVMTIWWMIGDQYDYIFMIMFDDNYVGTKCV